ncbi:LIM domain-containing protein WLIM2b-like [Impatiens glandulifera]|uniref:LIM domain-containing protein WLIM2b-like n=1 Tax=Impatiens glandulifera TaxID=253017 RepID=UPI001FB1431F|nr:LIM domain-containing protein WLIM2b-like [Impatiens glandulifera]
MSTFTGTTQKCKSCDKTVHFAEMITADGTPYHKTCFRCKQCNGRLEMGRYSLVEGVLYCKPHFEQFLRETGGVAKKPQSSARESMLTRTPSKVSTLFSGTQDKCAACKKTVYPVEKVTVEGEFYHKLCFKCAHGGCKLEMSNYAALDGFLYCKTHFIQLFKQKGNYSHLTKTSSINKKNEQLDQESTKSSLPDEPEVDKVDPDNSSSSQTDDHPEA